MLLTDKNAVIYGGGGNIGGAVARAFAREGEASSSPAAPCDAEAVADEIGAEWAVVDALDADAVEAHADAVGRDRHLVQRDRPQRRPGHAMAEMDVEDYLAPVVTAVRTNLLTWKAAARHGAGVILVFGGEGDPFAATASAACRSRSHALEAMRRQFSTENRDGVRVVTLRTGGIPETIPTSFARREEIDKSLNDATLSGRAATLETSATSPRSWPPTTRGR